MFTDMVGFTSLTQANESLSLEVLDRHRRLLRPIFPKYRGVEIKTIGDSFLVEFGSALDATNCAMEIQETLHDYNLSSRDEWRIRLRIGIHLGDVVHEGGDVLGDAVNIASRIEPVAEAEGVCVSEQVFAQVRNKVSRRFVKLVPKALKNVQFPVDVYKIEMPWEFGADLDLPKETGANLRLAVLPFANMSPDPNDEFFADGLTEEMITELSKIQGLRVIARTSVMPYKASATGVRQFAKELSIGSVREGSVRTSAGKVRITAQLINAVNEEHLWADRYDRELNDIFAVQSEIAANVAASLRMKLLTPSASPSRETESIEAHTLYLRGRFLWNKRSTAAVQEALNYFRNAIEKDPSYARAYTGIADCYSILVDRNDIPWSVGGPKGKEACEKALELDDALPEAHASMGLILTREFDYPGAEREYTKAIELNPGYASAYQWYALSLVIEGKMTEATRIMAIAEEADPLSPIILHNSGYDAWVNGKDAQALEKWTRGLEVNPGFDLYHFDFAAYFISKSLVQEAMAELKRLDSNPNATGQMKAMSAFLHGCVGDKEAAQQCLRSLVSEAESAWMPAGQIAWAYAGLGDVNKFYEWAMKSTEDRSFLPVWLRTLPLMANLRSDPRYREFLAKWEVQA